MGFFDDLWDVVKEVAPVVATVVGGPEGAIISAVTKAVLSKDSGHVALSVDANEDQVVPVVAEAHDDGAVVCELLCSDAGKELLAKIEAEFQEEVKALMDKVTASMVEGLKKL